ncbi:MAG: DUF5658 family protein [Candidatus Nanoarchaeia archaeon]
MEKNKLLKISLVIFFILNLADIMVTVYALEMEHIEEANPIVRTSLESLGVFWTFLLKVAIGVFIVVAMSKVSEKTSIALPMTMVLATLYLLILINNLVVIW